MQKKQVLKLRESINRYRYKNLILDLHKIGAVKFGEFTLKSGMVSPIYLDLRVLVSHPEVMKITAKAYSGLLENIQFDRMAAVPYAAMPIVAAVSAENSRPWIYTRKESKEYGTKKMIEGEYNKEEKVVVVDDMTTNGASKLEVIGPFEKEGLKVSDIVVLVDREQGAKGLLAKKGYKLHSVLPMSNILDILKEEEIIDQAMLDTVKEFLAKNSK
jgi:uridine monophosphate synthetase